MRNLYNKTLLVSRVQSHTTKMVLNEMKPHGFQFHECLEVGSADAIHEMVKAGQGIAFQPDWAIERHVDTGGIAARALTGVRLQRRWAFVSRAKKQHNVVECTLLGLCRTFAENISA